MPDPPKPRPGSLVGIPRAATTPDRRDIRRTAAPPIGSELDLLRQQAEAIRSKISRANLTPVNGTPFESVEAKAGRAAGFSEVAVASIAAVREEFRAADTRLEWRLDKQDATLSEQSRQLVGVQVTVGEIKGSLGVLVDELKSHRTAQTLTLTTKLRVEEADGLDQVAARASRRWPREKILLVVIAPVVAAATALLTALVNGSL